MPSAVAFGSACSSSSVMPMRCPGLRTHVALSGTTALCTASRRSCARMDAAADLQAAYRVIKKVLQETPPELAADENPQTFWVAGQDTPGQTLTLADAAHAELLKRAGERHGAARAYQTAIELSANAVERAELGSGNLIPGFEDGLTGVKAGDSRNVDHVHLVLPQIGRAHV